MNQSDILKYGTIAGATSVGFIGGYFVARRTLKKTLEQEYADLADREITQAREMYKARFKEGKYATPESTAAAIRDNPAIDPECPVGLEDMWARAKQLGEDPKQMLLDYMDRIQDYTSDEEAPEAEAQESAHQLLDPNLQDTTKPYVITREDFYDNETEYQQNTLTWYRGDRTLADEHEMPIPDNEIERVVGRANLDLFGLTGDEDGKTIYIRNHAMRVEFEVVLNEQKFSVVVLGEDALDAIPPNVRRNRGRDD